MKEGSSTPWGPAQRVEKVADGIRFVATASHGGYHLAPSRLVKMPRYLKDARTYNRGPWFEEDCESALVVLAFPDAFLDGAEERAGRAVKSIYPRAWHAHERAKRVRCSS